MAGGELPLGCPNATIGPVVAPTEFNQSPCGTRFRLLLAHFCRLARCAKVVSLYEAPPVKRFFLHSTFFDSDSPLRSLRAHLCIHGNGSPFCLAALSSQPPLARKGRAFRREGLTAKARAERQ
jgi:hypothetical protein